MLTKDNFTIKGLHQLVELEKDQIRRKKAEVIEKIEEVELLGTEIKGHEANIRIYQRELRKRSDLT